MGLDFDQLFPARFLKAGEFKGLDVTLTITSVVIEELEGDKGVQVKGIVSFKETKKSWVINKTNAICLRAMWGRDTGDWVGKRVTLWPAPIDFGDADLAIRVRGSPDIAADIDVEIKLARKKARTVKMVKTRPTVAAKAAPAPAPSEPPEDVRLPGDEPDAFGEVAL